MIQTYLCGLRKPQNIFCGHSKLHIAHSFKLIWPCRSHLIFVKIYLTCSLCFYGFHGQNKPKISQNWFHTILNNSINKKAAQKNLWRSKIERGVGDRFDRGQRFNFLFCFVLNLPLERNSSTNTGYREKLHHKWAKMVNFHVSFTNLYGRGYWQRQSLWVIILLTETVSFA